MTLNYYFKQIVSLQFILDIHMFRLVTLRNYILSIFFKQEENLIFTFIEITH